MSDFKNAIKNYCFLGGAKYKGSTKGNEKFKRMVFISKVDNRNRPYHDGLIGKDAFWLWAWFLDGNVK